MGVSHRRGHYKMAASLVVTPTKTSSRFDGKLDALLRRELHPSDYERIVGTEVCISVSRGSGKKAHGHVIIGPSHLFFAPIPVKRVKPLLLLSDVSSVSVINDQPDFLSGKKQEQTVHLVIEYKSSDQTTPTSSPNRKSLLATSPTRSLKLTRPLKTTPIVEGEEERKVSQLDLYLLQSETLFVSYLNYHLEDVQLGRRQYSSLLLDKQIATQRFHSLKSDLLSAKTIHESAKLYLELSSALGSYFQLKLLLWQDNGELLFEGLKDMKKWRDSTPADILEYKIIVTEVILKAFQDTLISKPKLSLLMRNNGQTVNELSSNLLDSLDIGSSNGSNNSKAMDELAVNISAILFELSRVIQQMNWCGGCSYNLSDWSRSCSTHQVLPLLLKKMINNQIGALSTTAKSDAVNPALINYTVIPLLLVWVTSNPLILTTCKTEYSEEFQYAIQSIGVPLVGEKLQRLRTLILS